MRSKRKGLSPKKKTISIQRKEKVILSRPSQLQSNRKILRLPRGSLSHHNVKVEKGKWRSSSPTRVGSIGKKDFVVVFAVRERRLSCRGKGGREHPRLEERKGT